MDNQRIDTLLKTLSDPSRRDVARLLGEIPLTVGEIVHVLKLPQSTVSRHLKALRSTGLILERRDGNRVISTLAEPANNGDAELPDLLNHWLRKRPLPKPLKWRLQQVLADRVGEEDAFGRLAHQWDEIRRQYFGVQFHLEALIGLLPEEWHVLDIGTGTGYLLPHLARQFSQITAVDPSPAMLDLARQRARQQGLKNIRFEFGRLEALPLPKGSVDVALAILVLHHAEDLPGSLQELRRVVKPGGWILAVDLAPHEMESFQREMADPVRGIDPPHLVEQMIRCGLEPSPPRALPTASSEGKGPEKEAPQLYLIKSRRPAAEKRPAKRKFKTSN